MATRRLYRPHWSPEILDEVARNLAIARRIEHLNRALPGAPLTGRFPLPL